MSEAGVELRVNGAKYGGWTAMRISPSPMTELCGSFELTVTDRWSGADIARPIKKGDLCHLLIDGEQIIAGIVDARVVSYDKESHSISISGRDATADLVDCSAKVVQMEGQTLKQVADIICKPFDITVHADTDVGAAFASRNAEAGQSGGEVLLALAAHRGLLLTTDDLGNLRITKPSNERSPGGIVFGKNVLACNAQDSASDQFSEYTVMHQYAQSDETNGEVATEGRYTSKDKSVSRYRPLTIIVDEGADLKKRADFERNVRAGKGKAIVYTVDSWYAAPGVLWKSNTNVPVTDPNQEPRLDNTLLMITNTDFICDESGTRAELTVMPKSALDVLAEPEADSWG